MDQQGNLKIQSQSYFRSRLQPTVPLLNNRSC